MRVQGYMVGTVLYFAIVYSLPISMGLAAVALDLPVRQQLLHNCSALPGPGAGSALCSAVQ